MTIYIVSNQAINYGRTCISVLISVMYNAFAVLSVCVCRRYHRANNKIMNGYGRCCCRRWHCSSLNMQIIMFRMMQPQNMNNYYHSPIIAGRYEQ